MIKEFFDKITDKIFLKNEYKEKDFLKYLDNKNKIYTKQRHKNYIFTLDTVNDKTISEFNVPNSEFIGIHFKNVNFLSCNLNKSKFIDCTFENVLFDGCNLKETLFKNDIVSSIKGLYIEECDCQKMNVNNLCIDGTLSVKQSNFYESTFTNIHNNDISKTSYKFEEEIVNSIIVQNTSFNSCEFKYIQLDIEVGIFKSSFNHTQSLNCNLYNITLHYNLFSNTFLQICNVRSFDTYRNNFNICNFQECDININPFTENICTDITFNRCSLHGFFKCMNNIKTITTYDCQYSFCNKSFFNER